MGYRPGLSANVDVNGNLLTIDMGMPFQGTGTTACALAVDIERRAVEAGTKIANRKQYVKIRTANAVQTTVGPWCVGVPDAIRLRGVYLGDVSVSTASQNVTEEFYIDHNQTANYLDLGYLYKKPGSGVTLTRGKLPFGGV